MIDKRQFTGFQTKIIAQTGKASTRIGLELDSSPFLLTLSQSNFQIGYHAVLTGRPRSQSLLVPDVENAGSSVAVLQKRFYEEIILTAL